MSIGITGTYKIHKYFNMTFPSIFICCSLKEQGQWKECF